MKSTPIYIPIMIKTYLRNCDIYFDTNMKTLLYLNESYPDTFHTLGCFIITVPRPGPQSVNKFHSMKETYTIKDHFPWQTDFIIQNVRTLLLQLQLEHVECDMDFCILKMKTRLDRAWYAFDKDILILFDSKNINYSVNKVKLQTIISSHNQIILIKWKSSTYTKTPQK
jgi:hypothetical protein